MEKTFLIDYEAEKKDLDKYANFAFLLDIWLSAIENGKSVADFFIERHYKSVAIYGMGMLGNHLYNELNKSVIEITFTVDKSVVSYPDLGSFKIDSLPEHNIKLPDVMVVTPIGEYEAIKNTVRQFVGFDIVSLEEVIMSL